MSESPPESPGLELDPALVEEAVFLCLCRAAGERDRADEWEREREALFALHGPRERERAFAGLGLRWFERLGLARELAGALETAPRVRALGQIRVRRALGRRDEGSDLFDEDGRTRFEVALAPARFLETAALREFLVHECLYAEDMLDPAFGYHRGLGPGLADERARTELVRDRLAMLWRARTCGRAAAHLGEPAPLRAPPAFRRAFAGALDAGGIDRLHERAAGGDLLRAPRRVPRGAGSPAAGRKPRFGRPRDRCARRTRDERRLPMRATPTAPTCTETAACRHGPQSSSSALRASLPDEHPVATLLDEHQVILGHLARLEELVSAGRDARPDGSGLEQLERLAAHLIGAEPHHQREEQVLFPALQEHGVHGPPEAMASEHVRLRALKHALAELLRRQLAGEEKLWGETRATAETLIEMLRAHIAKEDGVLFPLALRVLREPALWAELRRRCDAIGYCCSRAGASPVDERR